MIRTEAELKSADEFLNKDLDLYDYELSTRMDSAQYNLYMQDTEYYFDLLYEKLRVLEDKIEYLEYYSNNKITKLKDYIEQRSGLLEKMTDDYINKESTSVSVEWDARPSHKIKDRDGSNIPAAEKTFNYDLIPGGIKTPSQSIESISRLSDLVPYSNNVESCIQDKMYISFYSLDKPQVINETLKIKIPAAENFNFINSEPVNCNVKYEGLDEDNNIILKISCNNFFKDNNSFNYEAYSNTNLTKLTSNNFAFNPLKSVCDNHLNVAELKNSNAKADYLQSINHYAQLNDEIQQRSEKLDNGYYF